jgi:hypothetical protein
MLGPECAQQCGNKIGFCFEPLYIARHARSLLECTLSRKTFECHLFGKFNPLISSNLAIEQSLNYHDFSVAYFFIVCTVHECA